MQFEPADHGRLYAALMGGLSDLGAGVVILDGLRVVHANDAYCRITGYSIEELMALESIAVLSAPDTDPVLQTYMARRAAGLPTPDHYETALIHRNGRRRAVEIARREIQWEQRTLVMALVRDVTESLATQAELNRLALHDDLTGLANRTILHDRLAVALRQLRRDGSRSVALLVLDLDRFKEINETLGHAVGDRLLQAVAVRLSDALPESMTLARLGGDEFAISGLDVSLDEAMVTAAAVTEALAEPFQLNDGMIDVRASIGVVVAPEHGSDVATLLRRGDIAMYAAKRTRQPARAYSPEQESDVGERFSLIQAFRQALRRGDLVMYYQPKFDARTSVCVGAECLVRWPLPPHGLLLPDAFVPLLEVTDVVDPFTDWVLETAFMQLAEWTSRSLNIPLSVNLSAGNLTDMNLAPTLRARLDHHSISPNWLTVEITETAILAPQAAQVVRDLHALGLNVSVDDFGAGYSSLQQLKALPLTELKIDRSFISEMADVASDRAIVGPIIHLAHNLGLHVVAEGVENEATLEILREFGCDVVQGFHLGRPMTAEQLIAEFYPGWSDMSGNLESGGPTTILDGAK